MSNDYFSWLKRNKKIVESYLEKHDIPIEDIKIGHRATRVFKICGISTLKQFVLKRVENYPCELLIKYPQSMNEILLFSQGWLIDHKAEIEEFVRQHPNYDGVSHIAYPTSSKQTITVNKNKFDFPTVSKSEGKAFLSLLKERKNDYEKYRQDCIRAEKELGNKLAKSVIVLFTKIKGIMLKELGLSYRSFNHLTSNGLFSVSSVIEKYPDGLIKLRNIGPKSCSEIKQKILDIYI